jgi:class 3 adenylate cyclase
MLCEACGTANPAGNRFCDQCGAPLTSSCPACGEPNRGDARFCGACGSALAPPGHADETPTSGAREGPAAERRLVTVLFVDLVGFTAFASGRDPEHVRELQQGYFERAAASVAHHGGTVEKYIGDAVMAVWGTPVAHEDDAKRAVRAALEVVRAVEGIGHDLAARAGIVTGEAAVTVGSGNQAMVAGDMVNTASRLQSTAAPGEVLVDEATVTSAAGNIAFEPVEPLTLKGKAEPVPAWRALRVLPGRASDLVAPPFAGRASELRQLKEMLHGVGEDRRLRLASITGPAGIGKSRLAEELQSYADGLAETVWWHTGRSPSYGEGLAFWAVGEMVRRRTGLAEGDDEPTTRAKLAATLDDLVPDAAERGWVEPALLALLGIGQATGTDTLFAAWRTFFERMAERGTTVLVFEDLQWADTGTLEFIEHLLDWSRSQPILVVTLARPELFDHRPGWGTGRSNASAMALEPMPEADMRDLLRGLLPGLPDAPLRAIVERAGGIPLYAVEVVRALLTEGRVRRAGDAFEPVGDLENLPVPASLRSLIASRLDALDPGDRALLRDASVLGLSFTAVALAAVTDAPEAELEGRLRGLVRRELLEIEADPRSPERGQYRFVQSLIREVAYDMLSLRDRRSRHLAAARHLEGAESDEAAGALASHYLAAFRASAEGPEADAVAAQARVSLRAAAERAASLGAFSQAVRNLEHAIELTADPRTRYELLDRAAEFGRAAGEGEGVRCARLAVDAALQLDDPGAVVRAQAVLADALMDADEVVGAVGIL